MTRHRDLPAAPSRTDRLRDAVRWVRWGSKVLWQGTGGLLHGARGGTLAAALEPWMRCQTAADIPYEDLAAAGVRVVLFDLENTLVPPGGPFTPEARDVVEKVRAAGLEAGIVSNASASWVPRTLTAEGIRFVAPAGKPGQQAFERGCALFDVSAEQAAYVGDQVITDVFGAQRAGLRAILVEPRFTKEFWSAKFQRVVARLVVKLTRPSRHTGS